MDKGKNAPFSNTSSLAKLAVAAVEADKVHSGNDSRKDFAPVACNRGLTAYTREALNNAILAFSEHAKQKV